MLGSPLAATVADGRHVDALRGVFSGNGRPHAHGEVTNLCVQISDPLPLGHRRRGSVAKNSCRPIQEFILPTGSLIGVYLRLEAPQPQ